MIKRRIILKQLEALVYVADTGTFRKAAAALGTTQPNVSVRIASMEETLQSVLMHRDAGSVRLTEKETEILAAARETLRAAETLLEVADRQDLAEERLRLGVTELIAATWLHSFLRVLKDHYPSLRVELIADFHALGIIAHGKHTLASGSLRALLKNRDLSADRIAMFDRVDHPARGQRRCAHNHSTRRRRQHTRQREAICPPCPPRCHGLPRWCWLRRSV